MKYIGTSSGTELELLPTTEKVNRDIMDIYSDLRHSGYIHNDYSYIRYKEKR